jgi:hypothetical protein
MNEQIGLRRTEAARHRLRSKLDSAGVPYQSGSGTSLCFRDPDGTRVELIAEPLGEMYGRRVL